MLPAARPGRPNGPGTNLPTFTSINLGYVSSILSPEWTKEKIGRGPGRAGRPFGRRFSSNNRVTPSAAVVRNQRSAARELVSTASGRPGQWGSRLTKPGPIRT